MIVEYNFEDVKYQHFEAQQSTTHSFKYRSLIHNTSSLRKLFSAKLLFNRLKDISMNTKMNTQATKRATTYHCIN